MPFIRMHVDASRVRVLSSCAPDRYLTELFCRTQRFPHVAQFTPRGVEPLRCPDFGPRRTAARDATPNPNGAGDQGECQQNEENHDTEFHDYVIFLDVLVVACKTYLIRRRL